MRGAVADNNVAGPHFGDQAGIGPDATHRQYLDMKSLQDMAASLNLNGDVPLNELVRISEDAIQKSKILAQQGQLDLALVQYLRASDVVINVIPNHPDFNYMNRHHPRWAGQFSGLMMAVNSQHATMENIKRKLSSQHNPSYGHESSQSRPNSGGYNASPILPSESSRYEAAQDPPDIPIRMPSPSSFQRSPTIPAILQTPGSPSRKIKPEVKPKPENLMGKPTEEKTTMQDPLTQRFAELRNSHIKRTPIDNSGTTLNNGTWAPPSADSHTSQPLSHSRPRSVLDPPPPRPLGPREMNSYRTDPPAPPPKVPISSVEPSLPRVPSPAYSPVTTVPSQPPPNPPRTSVDSIRPVSCRQSSSWMGVSNETLAVVDDNPYRSRTPNGMNAEGELRNNTADMTVGESISAEDLLQFLRKYDILLIDVRPRDQYDSGHIYSKSIICIEPVILKENMSAEELEDRLVISPEAEQSLFSKRNEFDLIVYYDQNTSDPSYLSGSPASSAVPHLRALYDTLYEFNMYKPLKYGRQPAFLVGGLDAWVDLVGQQSLSTTHTAAIMHSVRARKPVPGKYQPLRRMPTASANSSWEVKKRRLREFKPLNPEEERAWLEKAKTEEIDPSSYGAGDGVITEEPQELESAEAELSSSFVHSYEDFLRRFPEPGDIRQSMAGLPMTDHQSTQFHEPLIAHPSRPPPAVPRPSYSGVTDGRHIQPSFARQASATKHALYKASSPLDRIKLPRTGLVNFGSTCYMNSIIQSLSATTELTKFFFNNHFHTVVQKNWKGSQGVLPGLYANLVRSLWKNDVEVIRPTSFRKFIGRLNSEWAGSQQQDAKEFFDVLVDCLHEDLNVNWQRTPLRPLTTEQEMRRERMPIHQVSGIEWNRYCHREFSYISSLFAGQHASRLRCTTCRRTSTTYEAFYSISVEIPPSGKGDIYQCLRSYCQEEMLSGDEVWKCPHCRTEREATKQIILTRAPQFLVLHFKRFSASHRQQARKIHTPVYFPLSGLDMTPFMIQPPSTPPSQPQPNGNPAQTSAVSQSQTELSPNDLATSSPFIYNAYAVVRHLGSTIHEGHYISLVRDANRDCWRKFDDHRVTDFQPGNPGSSDCLQSEQAYLVFYERAPRN
ncbi:Ubiquitin carboxyl-terminal hydrolase family protein [Coccidioides posadasii C735 delta SOWgp]|uniref:Ubiquitin carboxyl-terminal hydrolase family protein n=1 Tax=Coccidioides posadasii (strain C735) TaxID=222929 RepID=C5PGZ2_COCP7|nr:Ubiquitin carboxyl-terminal hydrolase family protein [Coccidioides posadasii C735 delta SOWgp]EER23795.1 Ubiquitin carboxyl-terminal hydrolase family protein [Coccidioides posadasii C735 delta SOWgp]|eukprot:XP_003065940.1 Ubiquitin carboxyl-terminal hydrolase family protein [Coccidioides posadasii C735 delta SOWgp]